MLDLAKVRPDDYVIDLGSGDGRTVITAAKRGAKARGIEYNPEMVELSKRKAAKEGVAGKATFAHADVFESDFWGGDGLRAAISPSRLRSRNRGQGWRRPFRGRRREFPAPRLYWSGSQTE